MAWILRSLLRVGIATFGSFIAGSVGVVGLMLLAPLRGRAALSFGPPEYFAPTLLGLTLVAYLTQGSMVKALIMAVLGLLAGTVGMDPISGEERFTYGTLTLRDGFGLVPVAMGLFGIAEVVENLASFAKQSVYQTKIHGLLPNRQDWRDSAAPIARGSFMIFVIRPICATLIALTAIFLLWPMVRRKKGARREA